MQSQVELQTVQAELASTQRELGQRDGALRAAVSDLSHLSAECERLKRTLFDTNRELTASQNRRPTERRRLSEDRMHKSPRRMGAMDTF
jgi:septal ring factor EnvC (AmiA/AmiB activator)